MELLQMALLGDYSPRSLEDLPQPIPNGVPRDCNPKVFTFADAFEDLLEETTTGELTDIRHRYEQRILLNRMFPNGEPMYFFRQRLQSQGLLLDPVADLTNSRSSDDVLRHLLNSTRGIWETAKGLQKDFGQEGDLPLKAERALDPNDRQRMERRSTHRDEGLDKPKREPEHFDDLFDAARSAIDSGQRSWDGFIKTLLDHKPEQTSFPQRYQTKVVEEKEEHIDEHGYVHSTVIRREVDQDGNEIGRSSHYRSYPAQKKEDQSVEVDERENDFYKKVRDVRYPGEEDGKKEGWFWK